MNLLDGFVSSRTPCLVLPDTMRVTPPMYSLAHPGKVTVRIWLDAIWVVQRRGHPVVTYGTLQDGFGASKNLGRDVHAVDVARKYQPSRFNESNDRIMRLDGDQLTGYQVRSPRRLREIAERLREVAALLEATPEGQVPPLRDGLLGWYALSDPKAA